MRSPEAISRQIVKKFLDSTDNNFGTDVNYPFPIMYDLTEADRRDLEDLIARAIAKDRESR